MPTKYTNNWVKIINSDDIGGICLSNSKFVSPIKQKFCHVPAFDKDEYGNIYIVYVASEEGYTEFATGKYLSLTKFNIIDCSAKETYNLTSLFRIPYETQNCNIVNFGNAINVFYLKNNSLYISKIDYNVSEVESDTILKIDSQDFTTNNVNNLISDIVDYSTIQTDRQTIFIQNQIIKYNEEYYWPITYVFYNGNSAQKSVIILIKSTDLINWNILHTMYIEDVILDECCCNIKNNIVYIYVRNYNKLIKYDIGSDTVDYNYTDCVSYGERPTTFIYNGILYFAQGYGVEQFSSMRQNRMKYIIYELDTDKPNIKEVESLYDYCGGVGYLMLKSFYNSIIGVWTSNIRFKENQNDNGHYAKEEVTSDLRYGIIDSFSLLVE